jgi:xanthine dehydrogenase accessory factor
MATILVQGSGDIGSAVTHVLFTAGHAVVLQDAPCPAHTHRAMAFTDALYEGRAELDGLLAKRLPSAESLPLMLRCHRAVPVCTEPVEVLLPALRPDVVIDARMRKRSVPDRLKGAAPLTIGLGPNFEAGSNVDWAVETAWGDSLGKVLRQGSTQDLAGEPRLLAGVGRERFVYAPVTGVFTTELVLGHRIEAGQRVGAIGETEIRAPLAGFIRGLSHMGSSVETGAKILELDPREIAGPWQGLGERPRRIAQAIATELSAELRL